jgi:hypothetical protein
VRHSAADVEVTARVKIAGGGVDSAARSVSGSACQRRKALAQHGLDRGFPAGLDLDRLPQGFRIGQPRALSQSPISPPLATLACSWASASWRARDSVRLRCAACRASRAARSAASAAGHGGLQSPGAPAPRPTRLGALFAFAPMPPAARDPGHRGPAGPAPAGCAAAPGYPARGAHAACRPRPGAGPARPRSGCACLGNLATGRLDGILGVGQLCRRFAMPCRGCRRTETGIVEQLLPARLVLCKLAVLRTPVGLFVGQLVQPGFQPRARIAQVADFRFEPADLGTGGTAISVCAACRASEAE